VAVGDFNGDGKLDLAVVNSGHNVAVLLGNGDGTFPEAPGFGAGYDPDSVAVGDFNGDGKADLAVISASAFGPYRDAVAILINNTPAILSSLSLGPTSVTGGRSSTGTLTLSAPAPRDGAVVSLASNNAAATVPASVTVPEGTTSATFPVSTSAVAASTSVTISASYGNGTHTASLTVLPPVLSSLSLTPKSVIGGPLGSSTGTVTLNGPAPSGGALLSLSRSNAAATVPASVTVPEGATSATFRVNTSLVIVSTTVRISAAYNSTSRTAKLTVRSAVPGL